MPNELRPLLGEDYYEALLLRMALEHCATMKDGELKSYSRAANADALRALAQAGLIEIVEQGEDNIVAIVRPEGRELESRFLAERSSL